MATKISKKIECYKCKKQYVDEFLIIEGSEHIKSIVKSDCPDCLESNKITINGELLSNSGIFSKKNDG
jgi:hypothetical protein